LRRTAQYLEWAPRSPQAGISQSPASWAELGADARLVKARVPAVEESKKDRPQ
jgi:hypothetical protein